MRRIEDGRISRLDGLKHQAMMAQIRLHNRLSFLPHELSDLRKQVSYKLLVSPEVHEQAKISARAFTMDMIDFLWTDRERILSHLNADDDQRRLLPQIFECTKDSATFSSTYQPYVDSRGYPILIHTVRNIPRIEKATDERERVNASINAQLSPRFSIITRWDLSDRRTPTLSIGGTSPFSFTTDLTFIAAPAIINNRDQAAYFFSTFREPTSVTEYNLSQKDRIVVHHLGPEQLRESARTEQWSYLGRYKSGRRYNEFFIYGMYDFSGLTKG